MPRTIDSTRTASRVRRAVCLAIAIAVVVMSPLVPVHEAEAQSTARPGASGMKRSAGTLNRGGGSRRGNDLSSRKAGRSAPMSSQRTTSRPNFRSPGEDSDADHSTTDASDSSDSAQRASTGSYEEEALESESEEEPEVVDYGARTLGKSCMYGARGEVIFRPRGARCRGDEPPAHGDAAHDSARPSEPQVAPMAAQAPARDARARPDAPRARRQAPADPERPRGTCIIGGDGRVVYAPPGVDCGR